MPLYSLGANRPEVPEDGHFWIAPDAHVIGRVRLGRGVSIWFGAVLRGDLDLIDIGDGSNVQEGALLHTDTATPLRVGRDVTIGHKAIVHGCTIDQNTLIGMGAIVLDGAYIGRNCIIGAGAVVTGKRSYPNNSLLTGIPARVVRQLDEATTALYLREKAKEYVVLANRFAKDLVRIS